MKYNKIKYKISNLIYTQKIQSQTKKNTNEKLAQIHCTNISYTRKIFENKIQRTIEHKPQIRHSTKVTRLPDESAIFNSHLAKPRKPRKPHRHRAVFRRGDEGFRLSMLRRRTMGKKRNCAVR